MKYIIWFSILSLSSTTFAEECSLDISNQAIDQITSVAIPNCGTKTNIRNFINGKKEALCNDCLPSFTNRLPPDAPKPNNNLKSIDENAFFDEALNQYEKVISNALIDLTKIRVMPNTGSKFESSLKSCQLDPSLFSSCDSRTQKKIGDRFDTFKTKLATELANIISVTPTKNKSLLDRGSSAQLSCSLGDLGITEQNLNSINTARIEDILFPDFMKKVQGLTFRGNTFEDLIDTIGSNIEKNELLSHPIFAAYSANPKDLLQILQNVNPVTIEKLRENLYTKESGNLMDKSLAKSCDLANKTLVANICGEQYKNKNFKTDIKSLTDEINREYNGPISGEHSTNEKALLYNQKLIQLCQIKTSEKGLDINVFRKDINSNIDPRYADLNKEKFEFTKYQNDFSTIQENLCSALKNANNCERDNFQTAECKLLKKYHALKTKDSVDSKLANSSNEEVNSLLRSMIGNPKDITPETRKILVAEGILPKEDGQFVAQPKVPEREPNYFQKVASASSEQKTMYAAAPGKVTKSSAGSTAAATVDSFYKSPIPSISPSLENSAVSESSSMNTDILQNMRDLSQINSEIARRLMGSKTQSNVSRSDVRSIAESVLKEQRKIQPTTAMIDNTVEDFYSEVERKRDQSPIGGQMNQGTASLARPSQSEAQRRYNNQMNKALEDFGKGSRDVAMANVASDFSVKVQEGKDKESMSKVEVFTSLDKLEKANLADVLKLKAQKDAEGRRLVELVKKKENFILNVNKTSLMIKFTDSKDGFEIIRIGSSGTKIDDKVVSEVRSFIKENYSGVGLADLRKNILSN